MSELIAKLEAAEEGSRELSDEVLLACGWHEDTTEEDYPIWIPPGWLNGEPIPSREVCPTTSLDAALSLVPSGWFWCVGRSTLYKGWAHLNRLHPDNCNPEDEVSANASSPPLALCAAILRAREAEKE